MPPAGWQQPARSTRFPRHSPPERLPRLERQRVAGEPPSSAARILRSGSRGCLHARMRPRRADAYRAPHPRLPFQHKWTLAIQQTLALRYAPSRRADVCARLAPAHFSASARVLRCRLGRPQAPHAGLRWRPWARGSPARPGAPRQRVPRPARACARSSRSGRSGVWSWRSQTLFSVIGHLAACRRRCTGSVLPGGCNRPSRPAMPADAGRRAASHSSADKSRLLLLSRAHNVHKLRMSKNEPG